MNLLGLTAISYLGTCGIKVKNAVNFIIEAGDKGYVFDEEKLKSYEVLVKEIRNNDSKKAQRIIKSITPGYNIYKVGATAEQEKNILFENYLKVGALRPMTNGEKFNYQLLNTKSGKLTYIALMSDNRNLEEVLELATGVDMAQFAMNLKYEQFKSNCKGKVTEDTIEYAKTVANQKLKNAKAIANEKLENAKAQVLALTNKRK